jgi:hypothetical protein
VHAVVFTLHKSYIIACRIYSISKLFYLILMLCIKDIGWLCMNLVRWFQFLHSIWTGYFFQFSTAQPHTILKYVSSQWSLVDLWVKFSGLHNLSRIGGLWDPECRCQCTYPLVMLGDLPLCTQPLTFMYLIKFLYTLK